VNSNTSPFSHCTCGTVAISAAGIRLFAMDVASGHSHPHPSRQLTVH